VECLRDSFSLGDAAELFGGAIEADAASRRALLASAEPGLRRYIEGMLAAADAGAVALESPVWAIGDPDEGRCGLPAGTCVGRFLLGDPIGRGGMGTVYRAIQTHPRREVAVKVLDAPFPGERARRRFAQEAEALARLRHLGIAGVIEAGTLDAFGRAVPYLAMELVEGTPITAFAADRGLSTAERLELVALVADAVEHAHQRGVIHRDLKPSNILVDGEVQPRVLDFGVARLVDGPSGATSVQTVVGTYAYMAPEQLRSPRDVDTRSDVYALGVVAYELLTGALPHEEPPRDIVEAAVLAAAGSRIVRPSRVNRALGGDIERVLLKALEREPGRRYQSAGALAADLRAAARGEVVSAAPATVRRFVRGYARRRPIRFGVAATALLMLPVSTGVVSWLAVRAHRAEVGITARSAGLHELSGALLRLSDSMQLASNSMGARAKILEDVLPTLDRLAATAPDDAPLQRDLADANVSMATLLGFPRSPNLGRADEAVKRYERAVRVYERFGSTDPLRFPAALASWGETEDSLGHPDRADSLFRRAIAGARSLVIGAPARLEYWEALSDHVWRRVAYLKQWGRVGDIEAQLTTARDDLAPLIAMKPAAARDVYGRAYVIFNLAVATLQAGRYERALDELDRALAASREALALAPSDLLATALVGNVQRYRGQALEAVGRPADSAEAFGLAVEQFRRASAMEPSRFDMARIIDTALEERAGALSEAGDFEQATRCINEAADRLDAARRAEPDNQSVRRHAALTHWTAARVYLRAGSTPPADTDTRDRDADLIRARAECLAAIDAARTLSPPQSSIEDRVTSLRAEVEAAIAARRDHASKGR
jgi:tetratricopeptide (TPR) repeat protein